MLERSIVLGWFFQFLYYSYDRPYTQEQAFLTQHSDPSITYLDCTAEGPTSQASPYASPGPREVGNPCHLACSIPPSIWAVTWLNFRSANENMFMWQLIYRVIATQRWHFPMRSRLGMTPTLGAPHVLWEHKKTFYIAYGPIPSMHSAGNGANPFSKSHLGTPTSRLHSSPLMCLWPFHSCRSGRFLNVSGTS